MTGAFQSGAFQSNAFQIEAAAQQPGVHGRRSQSWRRKLERLEALKQEIVEAPAPLKPPVVFLGMGRAAKPITPANIDAAIAEQTAALAQVEEEEESMIILLLVA